MLIVKKLPCITIVACALLILATYLVLPPATAMARQGASSTPQSASTAQTAHYVIHVPTDWSVEKNDSAAIYMHPQQRCAITISLAPHQGVPMRELGIAFYENLHGTKAKADDDGMTFSLRTESSINAITRLTYQDTNFMLVTATGSCENLQKILQSIALPYSGPRPYPLLHYYAQSPPKH